MENGHIFNFWVCGLKILGSGGRWWALLRRFLYNQVLGRGLMGSRVSPGPPLARSRVKIPVFCRNNTFSGKQQPWGVARATAHARHGLYGAHGGPMGPMGAQGGPWGPPWGPMGPQGGPRGPAWAQDSQGTLAKGTRYRCMSLHCTQTPDQPPQWRHCLS